MALRPANPTLHPQVCAGIYPDVSTVELDNLSAETSAYLSTDYPEYSTLAARIVVSNLHKNTKNSFAETMLDLHTYINPKTGTNASLIASACHEFIQGNAAELDACMDYDKDKEYDFFAFKTLERSYLLRLNGEIVERPQHMLMRVAVGIHQPHMERVKQTYSMLSEKWFTHASPTLFNAATPHPQLSSCFLLQMTDDSIEGIYETLKRCALISKTAGGIGLNIHNVRATNSYIAGTNGKSNGIVPMLRVFNDTARYVDQGGGKRKGSFAIYLEPWHADIFDFLDLKKNHGKEEQRARDLFYAMWIPDMFMERVQENGEWPLFCPHECPGLSDCWGEEFKVRTITATARAARAAAAPCAVLPPPAVLLADRMLYVQTLFLKYETEGKMQKSIKAQQLWFAILESQVETGTPYMLYKDACNRKSNQQNLGTIKCSNLCTEIVEYTSPDEVAVCNLASINLRKFVSEGEPGTKTFDFEKLRSVTHVVARNLNTVIDINYYPVKEAETSNMRHRPIGIGIQGLADAFMLLRLPYEGEEARQLNRDVFETIYFAALETSCILAQEEGTYQTYKGSPVSKGILQPDMWGVTPTGLSHRAGAGTGKGTELALDWGKLRADIAEHGVRNSLLLAPMPTASTAQIMGNNESFEPYTSNMYNRRVLSGEFTIVNKHLLKDLLGLGLWPKIKNQLIQHNGSVQNIPSVPQELKEIYKTAWEMKGRAMIDMAADRGAYIDQSQSFNVFMENVTTGKLTSMHFYAWKKGLKTGQYYLRTKAAADAIKFTVDKAAADAANEADASSLPTQEEGCISCGA